MDDEVMAALDDVVEAADASAAESQQIIAKANEIKALRASGHSWRAILEREHRPRLVERMSAVLARLSQASGRFRRSQAKALREEGVSTEQVASLFGVTRQRVSALLRQEVPAGD